MRVSSILKLRLLSSLALLPALTLMGCGLGESATMDSPSEPATMFGTIKGGNVPIAGAAINLYQAGSGGYGLAVGATNGPKLLATYAAAGSDPGTGAFSFTKTDSGTNDGSDNTWHCPTDGSDPLIYILGIGGDPTGGTTHNYTQIVLAAVLDKCSNVGSGTRVNLNEISTIAFASSFGQFMYPGTSTPGQEGISTNGTYIKTGTQTHQSAVAAYNAFLNLSNNLIYIPNGGVWTSQTYSGTAASVANIVVTATPEFAKLVAAANILSACVNSDPPTATNSYCAQLFDAAQPPPLASATAYGSAFPTAVDTLQAALYMTSLNPGGVTTTAGTGNTTIAGSNTVSTGGTCSTNLASSTALNPACLYNLIPKNPAFTTPSPGSDLTAAPSDWSISITFSAGGDTSESGTTLTLPSTNKCTGSGPFLWNTQKSVIDASGNIWFIGGDGTSSTTSTHSNIAAMSPIGQPLLCFGNNATAGTGAGLTIDPSGNVWGTWSDSTTKGLGKVAGATATTISYINPVPEKPTTVASDGNGNILFTGPLAGGTIYKLASGGTSASTYITPANVSDTTDPINLLYFAVDPLGNPWSIQANTSLYTAFVPNNIGSAISITKWLAAASSGGFATYTFTGPNSSQLIVGDTVLLNSPGGSGFATNTKAKSPYPVLQNLVVTVASTTSTTFTASIASTQTAITTQSTDVGDTATRQSGDGNLQIGTTTTSNNSYGLAIDSNGYVYSGITCCGSSANFRALLKFTPDYATGVATRSQSVINLGGINGVRAIALDGAANAWITNEYSATTASTTATAFYPIVEIASSGSGTTATFAALTPSGPGVTNTTCTTGTAVACPTMGGLEHNDIQYALDIAIDPSGNVWVPNNQSAAAGSVNVGTIVEIVGVAVPVVTPLTPGTSLATSKLATKP